MARTYVPGRSRWTGATGWLMVASALGAIVCALTPLSRYPPLTAALSLAGASAFFACCWVVASYRARTGPLDEPWTPRRRRGDRVLPWIFAFGVPFAVAAALMVLFAGFNTPAHPEEGVAEDAATGHLRLMVDLFVLFFVAPFLVIAGSIAKMLFMDESDLRDLRRFRPGVHLPALAVLLVGLVLLLPVALGFQVHGYSRLPALLASLTPVVALAWVARKS
ncbi:hypothetical protein ACFXDJ_27295 [Streptomyces sp. NPDC059443]|uniref:hypothetical protein n=1 Tax=unclassified Streptomyces TaxID=2593676 RepID=UPI0036750AD3